MIFHLSPEREAPEGTVQYRTMAERHDGTGRMVMWTHDTLTAAERRVPGDSHRVRYWIEEWTWNGTAWALTDSNPRTGKEKG